MIEFFEETKDGFEKIDTSKEKCWINAVSPTKEEVEEIKKLIDIPDDILSTLSDLDEIPMIEKRDSITFIIIRTPHKTEDSELEYSTLPLGIAISDKYFVTLCFSQNEVVEKLKTHKFSIGDFYPALKLILISAKGYMNYLIHLNKKINAIEKNLEKATKNEHIIKLMHIQKSLVYFSTSLESNQHLLDKLTKYNEVNTEHNKEVLDDIIDENKQAIQMTVIYSKVINGMMSSFGSIISNNLNNAIKFLTAFTIILMIPTLVASIYGMNIGLPFQNHEDAFLITMLISIFFIAVGAVIFWRKELI